MTIQESCGCGARLIFTTESWAEIATVQSKFHAAHTNCRPSFKRERAKQAIERINHG